MILSNLAYQNIAWGIPCNDPRFGKCIFLGELDLTGGNVVTFDPTSNPQLADVQNIQSVYLDNAVQGITTIQVSGSNFVLRIPAFKVGFFPLITGDRPVFTISRTATSSPTRIYLTNLPAIGYCYPIDHF